MKKKLSLPIKIFSLIVLSFASFFYFLHFDPVKDSLENRDLVAAIQDVKMYGLNQKQSVIRRVGQEPKWLDPSIKVLYKALETGKESSGLELTESTKIEILSAIGGLASYGQSGTALILKVYKEAASRKLRDKALQTLVRVRSNIDSVAFVLQDECKKEVDKDIQKESRMEVQTCAALLNLGGVLETEQLQKVDQFQTDMINELDSLIPAIKEDSTLSILSKLEKNLFYIGVLGQRASIVLDPLIELLDPMNENEVKLVAINAIRDIVPGTGASTDDVSKSIEKAVSALSSSMQYDSSRTVREQALMSLVGIASEASLMQVRSYGHKYVKGETRPEPVVQHPFREWAFREKLAGNTSKLPTKDND